MASSQLLLLLFVSIIGLSLQQENQNFLNFPPQGRFLSSFPQSSRNGFFPVQPRQQQQQQTQQQQLNQPGSYQQENIYSDGPTNPPFFPPFSQSFGGGSTRSPNSFEISPRPFTVTASPLQTRGQFSNFGSSDRSQLFGFDSNPYNFAPVAQQQQPQRVNPFLDATGYGEDEYEDRQTYVSPQRSRVRGSSLKIDDDHKTIEKVPSQAQKSQSNKDKLRENLRQRPTTSVTTPRATPESKVTSTPSVQATRRAVTLKATVKPEQPSKKTRYSPITRSTTSKRPQPKLQQLRAEQPEIEYNDQTYSFSKNSKVKSPSYELNVKPLHYQVNISHSESDGNGLSVKSLAGKRAEEQEEEEEISGEEGDDDDVEYIDYEEDYGVILNEEDRAKKEKVTTEAPADEVTTLPPPSSSPSTTTTTVKPDDHTVIIFDNFILPKNNEKQEEEEEKPVEEDIDDDVEYEYEYFDEPETTEKLQTTKTPEKIEITTYRDPKRILSEQVVSVVTSKTVVNGTMHAQDYEEEEEEAEIEEPIKTTTEPENYPSTFKPFTKSTTDNYFVVASVQTSRSVSGAHFLPFPHVEQRETIHTRAELGHKKVNKDEHGTTEIPGATTQISEIENVSAEEQDEEEIHPRESTSTTFEEPQTTLPTTMHYSPLPSTESIIDKLDGIQSDLSLGVLSGEYPVLKDSSSKKSKTTTTTEALKEPEINTTFKPLVLIRKFSPKSTTTKPSPTTKVTAKSSTATITLSTEEPVTTTQHNSVLESSQRANKKLTFENTAPDELAGLLPPGYKPRNSFKNKKFGTTQQPAAIKEEALPGKVRNATISRSFKSQPANQEVKFRGKDEKKTFNKLFENDSIDISKLLPPDFKDKKKPNESLAVIPLDIGELSKFLPPGFKLDKSSTTEVPKIKFIEDDISKFLPPGYKPPLSENKEEDKKEDISSILSKIKFQDASVLLPPGFKKTEEESTTKSNKLIFPTRLGKKPTRVTTPKPNSGEGPKPPEIQIKKGPPTRATTEFTGWPTKPTTPISIERLLELQKNAERINIADILMSSTTEGTTTPSSTTSTTTSTTPRPREATICKSDCSLAATIRIIEGVEWSPELLVIHTDEYKNLANELETDLNEVYSNSPSFKKLFKGVRIDSFSKGSVLVDYFIELNELQSEMNTSEIKRLFHESLTPVTVENETIMDEDGLPQPIIKETFKLGNFIVDPVSTDFIVIRKVATFVPDDEEENILPQWAIAMITIGFLSLVCVILFGVAVLISRKKAAKKTPTALTADMLNQLNKNHMSGLENFGADDVYNLEDTWDERREVKPKRASSQVPNMYDSWRSQHLQRFQADEFYHYDSHDPYNDYQPKQQQHHHPSQPTHPYSSGSTNRFTEQGWNDGWDDPPYSQQNYNNSRKHRDYDQHF